MTFENEAEALKIFCPITREKCSNQCDFYRVISYGGFGHKKKEYGCIFQHILKTVRKLDW